MRSQLTRHVFRRLLHNQPLILHARPTRTRHAVQHGRLFVGQRQARTFINMFQRPQKDLREPFLDPGMEKMLELDKRIHLVARLPPKYELVQAFNEFVTAKRKSGMPIQDFHAARLVQTLSTIESDKRKGSDVGLSYNDLLAALQLLGRSNVEMNALHAELGGLLYAGLERRAKETSEGQKRIGHLQQMLYPYAVVLARTGRAAEARGMVVDASKEGLIIGDGLWASLIEAFSSRGQQDEVSQTLKTIEDLDLPIGIKTRRELTLHHAKSNNAQQVKEWFTDKVIAPVRNDEDSISSVHRLYKGVLEFALRNNELEWAKEKMAIGDTSNPGQRYWNAILQAAAMAGKSVDDVNRMISVMSRRHSESGGDEVPPIETFNGLMEQAVRQNDAYSAERYFALAEKWGAQPNAQTFILQVAYRLAAKDYDGAQNAYARLRDQAIVAHEDWDIMNQYVQTLVVVPDAPHELIMGLVEDLSERKKPFPAETVKALCKYHISRDEYLETVDLLQTYTFQFSIAQRTEICELLLSIALNPASESGRCWDTYMIFHQVFDIEAKREPREKIMVELYRRGRPDLATHVFTRMSKHMRADTRPNAETYIAAFEGIASSHEPEALEVVHNILKLDTETEPDTRMRNALMLAYSAVGASWRSLQFWEEISSSDEGPTYESLSIAFAACERAHEGYETADAIWARLLASDIEIHDTLFASYVGALAGNDRFEDAVEAIGRMHEVTGGTPNEFVAELRFRHEPAGRYRLKDHARTNLTDSLRSIGSLFNATRGAQQQERVQAWALDNHGSVWRALEAQGVHEDEMGIRHFAAVDRTLHA